MCGSSSTSSCPSPSNCRAWYLLHKGTWRCKETRRRFSPCPQQRVISFYPGPSSHCLLPGERVQDTPGWVLYLDNIFVPERTAGFHQSAPSQTRRCSSTCPLHPKAWSTSGAALVPVSTSHRHCGRCSGSSKYPGYIMHLEV